MTKRHLFIPSLSVFLIFLVGIFLNPRMSWAFDFYGWYEGAEGYQAGLEEHEAGGDPLIVYFYTDWCPHCARFNENVLNDSGVERDMDNMIKVYINLEKGPENTQVASRYGVRGFPAIFLHVEGKKNAMKLQTHVPPEEFRDSLEELIAS